MTRFVTLTLISLLSGAVSAQTSQPTTWEGRVTRVVDGDTVEVTRPAAKGCITIQKVRIRGVDAPEKAQPYGKMATRFTAAYLFNHNVTVKVKEKDRYGRWVADLCRGKSKYRCVSYQLVRKGWAWWYRKYEPKNKLLKRAEAKARKQKLGLWAGKNPLEPWLWRQKRRK
jgi:endonuclease YncB( thermonuclease family)